MKRMRRLCTVLVEEFPEQSFVDTEHLVDALCERMGRRLGRSIVHHAVRFQTAAVSGMWLATDSANHLLYERDTSPLHQVTIVGHELWHMETGEVGIIVDDAELADVLSPTSSEPAVTRIIAQRTNCSLAKEQESELFASVLATTVSRWLPTSAQATRGALMRLEGVLGPDTREDWLG